MPPIRLGLVEDNPRLRHRLVERLRFFDEVELVLTAETGESFLRQVAACGERPQVVLMDIELPGISGIETTARLKALHPDVDVLMLTVFDDADRIFESIQAGASGYLLKDAATEQVVSAALELTRGGAPMSPEVARKVMALMREHSALPLGEAAPDRFDLTPRETEVLTLLVEDETEPLIADRLFISPHTVRTHIKNIYKKLHVHSRASVVRVALQERLVPPHTGARG